MWMHDLEHEEIDNHLRESSSRATHNSTANIYKFLKCLSDFSENGLLSQIVVASEFSLLAKMTSDAAERAELSIFHYVDSNHYEVKQSLGPVVVIGTKGAEALCILICKMLSDKGIDIRQLMFNRFDGTKMIDIRQLMFNRFDGTKMINGEITRLQPRFHHLAPH